MSNSNGELAVKTLKYLVCKTQTKGHIDTDEFQFGLMELRNAPRLDGQSPAMLLQGRMFQTKLPVLKEVLQAKETMEARKEKRTDLKLNQREKNHCDTTLPLLEPGQTVLIQDPHDKRWKERGVVQEKLQERNSYLISMDDGRLIHRNQRFLRRIADSNKPMKVATKVEEANDGGPRRSERIRSKPDRYQA